MSEFGYKFKEYEDTLKSIDEATKVVLKQRKVGKKSTAEDLKDKFGDKANMASIIIELTNACLEAKDLLRKMQGHNFDLRGKVADLASAEMKKMREEVRGNQNCIMSRIDEVREKVVDRRSFSEVLGKDLSTTSFVLPMKQAMKEIEKEDERGKNLVFHGLDIDPKIPQEEQGERIKRCATSCISEMVSSSDVGAIVDDIVSVKILGKVGDSGKAPPVLMTMKCSSEAQRLIRNSYRLRRVIGLRRVFVTPDLSKEAREERKKTFEDLKRKITDFPEQRWIIKGDTVTSVGKFVPKGNIEDNKLDRSFNY